MRLFFLFITIMLTSCSSINPQLRNAIAYGDIIELNKYSKDIDKELFIRLFGSPLYKEDCFKETHGICQYQYFLTVSTFDEYPETNIYSLDFTGEISKVRWLPSTAIDSAQLELEMTAYTSDAIKNNNKLSPNKHLIKINVTPKIIKQSEVDTE